MLIDNTKTALFGLSIFMIQFKTTDSNIKKNVSKQMKDTSKRKCGEENQSLKS